MELIASLLKRHAHTGIQEAINRSLISKTIEEVIGYPCPVSSIQKQNGHIRITLPPILKTEILFKEDQLKKRLVDVGISLITIR